MPLDAHTAPLSPTSLSLASRAASDEESPLVQLPHDLPRASGSARRLAVSGPHALPDLIGTLDEGDHALLVAAVFALLQRIAQQSTLALAVTRDGVTTRLALRIDESESLAELAARLGDHVEGPCNVGLSFSSLSENDAPTATVAADHALHLFVGERAGAPVTLTVAYDAACFVEASIARLVARFSLLLAAGLRDGELTVATLPLSTREESAAIDALCDGGVAPERDEPAHHRFERLAREQPAAEAVRFGDSALSYGELDARATRLAKLLVLRGVTRESAVAVCLAPSLDVLVALLAVFKANAVYVPLDPTHPPAMIATIVDEVAPALVLTHGAVDRSVLPERAVRLFVDRETADDAALDGVSLARTSLAQAAYVLYTSGTTGRPKGVVASHQNLAHYLQAARERYDFDSNDAFCSLARYTFSISFFELLSPLTSGASLRLLTRDQVLDPARLCDTLDQVTVVHAGPSLLGSLFRFLQKGAAQRSFPNMRHASSGGDYVPAELLEQMKRVFPAAELFVIYGATEISCMGCTYPVPRARTVTQSFVGRPFRGVVVRVLDAHGRPVPFGVVGEIHFAGEGIARRYLKQPALTSEKFVCIDGRRFYRTGDLGRLSASGELEILGRRDFQVQLRGIRVELSGIEHTIRALGLASQCAVVAATRDAQDVRLVAFVVDPRDADTARFRRALATQLPDYMLPQAVIALAALPVTANGKLDRKQLGELALALPRSVGVKQKPETARQCVVAACFAAVLGVDEVGLDDDFFDLGGHSLSAVLLLEQLQNRLGASIEPALVFEHTSVRALARATESEASVSARPILLSKDAERPALFMLLGVHLYRELARKLEGHHTVYGLYVSSELSLLDGEHEGEGTSVRELAREYVQRIRSVQPHGPYRLGGMSFGGIVAYEAAQLLEREGEQVEHLVLLDAVLPQTSLSRMWKLVALPGRTLVRELSHRMWLKLGPTAEPSTASLVTYHEQAELSALEGRRQAAYRSAVERYMATIQPYGGAVSLVVAGERLAGDRLQDRRCGFAGLVSDLTVHELSASHLGLLEAPHVGALAALIARDLTRTSSRPCIVPSVDSESAALRVSKVA